MVGTNGIASRSFARCILKQTKVPDSELCYSSNQLSKLLSLPWYRLVTRYIVAVVTHTWIQLRPSDHSYLVVIAVVAFRCVYSFTRIRLN